MSKVKFSTEYSLMRAPATFLWPYLSTPHGLEQWFADHVSAEGKHFTFDWGGSKQEATLVSQYTQTYARFHWIDDGRERTFFEMRIVKSELSDTTSLVVTDFADGEDDVDEMRSLWDHQIDRLRTIIGCR